MSLPRCSREEHGHHTPCHPRSRARERPGGHAVIPAPAPADTSRAMLPILRSLDRLARWKKAALVLAGYVLAMVAGVVATWLYDLRFSPADQQASGGMIAFGELMFGAGVFAVVAAVPTALALWFVRHHRGTWEGFTIAS